MKSRFGFLLLVCACVTVRFLQGGESFWIDASDVTVATSDDAGVVSGVWGQALLKGQYMESDEQGMRIGISDRVGAGDEITTAANARVEIVTGNNLVSVIGPSSSIRILGVRGFDGGDGRKLSRLDLQILEGTVRSQVRESVSRPESVLLDLGGAQCLVTRGDAAASVGAAWRVAVLAGSVSCRIKQGGGTSAPYDVTAGRVADADGVGELSGQALADLKSILPFSYEIHRAALPPTPPPDPSVDAP